MTALALSTRLGNGFWALLCLMFLGASQANQGRLGIHESGEREASLPTWSGADVSRSDCFDTRLGS